MAQRSKNPILCILANPTWEAPKRTLTIRQSDLDELLADIASLRERYEDGADVSEEYDSLREFARSVKEAISAEEQLARYNYEDPCVARWA